MVTGPTLSTLSPATPSAPAGLPDLAQVAAVATSVAVALAPAGVVLAVLAWLAGRWRDRRAHRGARWISVLPPPQADPGGALAFWQQVAGLLLPPRWRSWLPGPHLSFEYVFRSGVITVGVWVPGTVDARLIASAIRSAWPGSRTDITPATHGTDNDSTTETSRNTENGRNTVVAGGALRLARPGVLPLADEVSGTDPLAALLGTAALLGRDQRARVQVLARPVPAARLARAVTGRTGAARAGGLLGVVGLVLGVLARAAGAVVATTAREVVELAGPPRAGHRPTGRPAAARSGAVGPGGDPRWAPGPARAMAMAEGRAVAGKASGAGSGAVVLIRYAAATAHTTRHGHDIQRGSGPDPADGQELARARTRRIAHALASSFAVFSGHNLLRRRRMWRPAGPVIAGRRLRRGDLLAVAELAALAHLPTADHVAGLRRAGAAAVAAPPQVAGTGPGIRPLGDSDATAGRPIGVTVADARHHLWIVGATGTGKSTLLVHGVLADAQASRSAVVLDPKGDLVPAIMARLTPDQRARVVLIDPAHPLRTRAGLAWPCLNPLSPHPGSAVLRHGDAVGDSASEGVVTIFSRVFASAWGFRSEDLLRVACLTVRAGRETPTLAMLPALLSDPDARSRAVSQLPRGSALREFWGWFESLAEPSRASISAPLLNKLRSVLLRPFAERVLCSGPSTVDLTHILDRGGLLLVRLPKLLGEDTARLVGSLIVAQVWQATLTRAAIPEHARKDSSLVLDECQNFLNLPFRIEDMLAEARGFRLSLTLAHQDLSQLTSELRHGISTNARSKVIFGCAADDATTLARHTEPEVSAHDLHHLDAFHAAARLMSHGAESRAFTLVTRDLPPIPDPGPGLAVPSRASRAVPVPGAVPGAVRQGGVPCPTSATTSRTGPARPVPNRPARRPGSTGPGRGSAAAARPGPARRPSPRPAPAPPHPPQR